MHLDEWQQQKLSSSIEFSSSSENKTAEFSWKISIIWSVPTKFSTSQQFTSVIHEKKMESTTECFLCTQDLPYGLMVCQNCAIFQSLVQDIVKTCIEKFRRVPKNFVEAWDLFYKESEVKSSRPKSLLQRQETCKLPRIKTIVEDSNMDLSAYPLMTSLDHFIPR